LLLLTILFFNSNLSIVSQNEFIQIEFPQLIEVGWTKWLILFAPIILLFSQADAVLSVQRALRSGSKKKVVAREMGKAFLCAAAFVTLSFLYQSLRVIFLPGKMTAEIIAELAVIILQKFVFLGIVLLLSKLGELFGLNRFAVSCGFVLLAAVSQSSYHLFRLTDNFLLNQDYLSRFLDNNVFAFPVVQFFFWGLSLFAAALLVFYFSNRWERI
jgi:hypothetical protein